MRNLLPQEDKEIIYKEYRMRIAIVSLLFLFFTILIAIVSVMPSYFISESKKRAVEKYSEVVKKSITEKENSVSNDILFTTKEKLKLLAFDKEHPLLKNIFEIIISDKPDGVTINGLSYNKLSNNKVVIVVGKADKRENLLMFKKLLERETLFTEIFLPVSDFALDRDIEFTIKISGNF
ncbi:hypothetical protein COT82_00965 [Candidatus Campbellbacteria bacterium CG10_big_fil_rev_8_21_14_0_10_35_52]|uniref:Uncharacterized protein n=1 Tax=Candidatus Campbellbacteria bacterium CG10_big_fil_rev_8_21_14_0_10_35_52 TaxID=1974527 RepID=A0A2M6WVL3_9BACT|nr:MAG: hypothetical protein COT82_00965 [Candidatus Campbellbacteria bacterium CG10_big_fil_rev_8_21_14_0_10_35_52]